MIKPIFFIIEYNKSSVYMQNKYQIFLERRDLLVVPFFGLLLALLKAYTAIFLNFYVFLVLIDFFLSFLMGS